MLKRHAKKIHPRSRFVFVLLCFIGVSQMLSPVRANRLATGETLTSIADTGRTEIRKQVVIQPGGSDDTVLEDATISSWSPDENYGGDPQVKIRPGDGAETMNALLRWNLDVVPTGSLIQSATLEMYCTQATGSPMGMSIFQVLRPWQEASVTWEKASTGMSWATAGCQAPGVDRASAAGAVAALELETGWRSWDITTLVQSWVDDPPANHGMVLVPAEFHPRTEYTFASAEAYASVRPRLIIEYSTSTRTPTPSPSPTTTPTFQATPTPTATSTAAATATASPTSAARGAIQGLVYQDWNEDGEFTAGEPGLGNVLVTLKDSTGRQIDFKTTASDGSFLFPSLTPGTYRVEQYDLPGTYSTTPNLIYVPIEAGDLLWVSFGDRYSTTLTPTAEATAPLFFTYLPLSSKSLSFPLDKPTPTATPTTISYSQAVNCGSSEGYQASDDFWYAPDQVYTPGSWGWEGRFSQTWVSGLDVQGTGDDPLYDSQRHSMDAYRFSVPAGQYQVLLCFAEIFQYVKAGDRLFAVEIEGRRVLDQFDMVALGARNRALEQVFTAPVSDGVLDVVFVPQTANYSPVINAIRVQRIKSPQ